MIWQIDSSVLTISYYSRKTEVWYFSSIDAAFPRDSFDQRMPVVPVHYLNPLIFISSTLNPGFEDTPPLRYGCPPPFWVGYRLPFPTH